MLLSPLSVFTATQLFLISQLAGAMVEAATLGSLKFPHSVLRKVRKKTSTLEFPPILDIPTLPSFRRRRSQDTGVYASPSSSYVAGTSLQKQSHPLHLEPTWSMAPVTSMPKGTWNSVGRGDTTQSKHSLKGAFKLQKINILSLHKA